MTTTTHHTPQRRVPSPAYPHDVGLEDEVPDTAHLEGAHLLANDARATLRADGFTDDEILVWADTFLAEHDTADVEEFLTWIVRSEDDRR